MNIIKLQRFYQPSLSIISNNLEWTPFGETGILLGLHIGKRFALAKGGEINLSLGGDCIIGWGIDFPVSLGISYGF